MDFFPVVTKTIAYQQFQIFKNLKIVASKIHAHVLVLESFSFLSAGHHVQLISALHHAQGI
jgi:hypothetical protein